MSSIVFVPVSNKNNISTLTSLKQVLPYGHISFNPMSFY